MRWMSKRRFIKRIALATLKLSIVIFFVVFVIGPLIFKYSYGLQRSVVFLNFVNWPKNPNYSNPSEYGLEGTRNIYLTTNEGVKLGVWHVLPENIANQTNGDQESFESAFNDGHDVVVYYHGNSGNRVAPHRVELYKVLRKKFHVIAFDYRSYGDSSDVEPSESGLVSDSTFVYRWIANRTSSKIFVWGHSLGTAISTHMLALLAKEDIRPAGLILESPFNNMKDEISEHPMARIFTPFPWFHYTIVKPMADNNLTFATDKHILKVDCPILIMHAQDDRIVPSALAYKLYRTALDNRKATQGKVSYLLFEAELNYGHKFICRSPNLINVITRFEADSLKESEDLAP